MAHRALCLLDGDATLTRGWGKLVEKGHKQGPLLVGMIHCRQSPLVGEDMTHYGKLLQNKAVAALQYHMP